MSKALKTKSSRYFTITLSVIVILISSMCWSKLLNKNSGDEIVTLETNGFSSQSKAKPSTQFGGRYMIITGVITAVVNYLPFKSDD